MRRILITGGAGFVGSNLAVSLAARHPEWEVIALDNLYRQGSELNLPRLRARPGSSSSAATSASPTTWRRCRRSTALIECSAEPSVMSGVDGDTSYLAPHQPHRRLQLPRAGPPRRRLLRLPLDQPRLPGGAAGRAEPGGGGDPLRDRRRAGGAGRLPGGDLRGLPAGAAPAPSTGRPSSPPSC